MMDLVRIDSETFIVKSLKEDYAILNTRNKAEKEKLNKLEQLYPDIVKIKEKRNDSEYKSYYIQRRYLNIYRLSKYKVVYQIFYNQY